MNKYVLVGLLFIVGLGLMVFGLLTSIHNQENYDAKRTELTQTICDSAHKELNGISEQACGLAQDTLDTEYLCNHAGTVCWVEAK